MAYDQHAGIVITRVIFITQDPALFVVELCVGDEKFVLVPTQRFFVPLENKWEAAKNLKPGDLLFSVS